MLFLKFLKKLNLKFFTDNAIFGIILWVSYLPRVEIHTFCKGQYFFIGACLILSMTVSVTSIIDSCPKTLLSSRNVLLLLVI